MSDSDLALLFQQPNFERSLLHVTVFVSRKAGDSTEIYNLDYKRQDK